MPNNTLPTELEEEVIKHFRINFDECKGLVLNEGIYEDIEDFISSASDNAFEAGYLAGLQAAKSLLPERGYKNDGVCSFCQEHWMHGCRCSGLPAWRQSAIAAIEEEIKKVKGI